MHILKNAPKGYVYRYKGSENEFASTVYIGNGRTIDDYELITEEEYRLIMEKELNNTITID